MNRVLLLLLGVLTCANILSASDVERYWVFFHDKRIPAGQERYALARAREALSERSIARRAKAMPEVVAMGDVPVCEEYVQRVRRTGAMPRRSSKWLNAVSVEADAETIERVQELACVRETRRFQRRAARRLDTTERSRSTLDDPDYGPSFYQYEVSRIPELHARGLSGAGVLLTVLDTGFWLEHESFDSLNLLGAYDFVYGDSIVANEEGQDPASQDWHGTIVLSVLAGFHDGELVAPAYGAEYLVAKTELVEEEIPAEEDNYVAALEWGDSAGTDILSSSLGYKEWYETSDMDGRTAVTTLAVVEAARRGILVVTAAGNERGSEWGTILSPADADSILAVGAVDSLIDVADFSSPGPSADGRIKPDLCTYGVGTYGAGTFISDRYITASGTSLATPIAAGIAALVMEAHPEWTAQQVREAMLMTASRATEPDNDYGYGLADAVAAADYVFSSTPRVPEPAPGSYAVLRAYPNPLNGNGTILLTLDKPERGGILLYDVTGREAMRWDSRSWNAGENALSFSIDGLATGMYWARFEGEANSGTAKIVVLK